MPQRRTLFEQSSAGTVPANSDSGDPPSGGLAAFSDADRATQLQQDKISPLIVTKHRQNGENGLTGFRNISNISGASTIDAPGSAEKEQGTAFAPGAVKDHSAAHQPFDTSHLQRQVTEVRRQYEQQQPYIPSGEASTG
jgi:hypothetical protein